MRQSSLFESFNARSLQPELVGQGFVFSPAFVEVAARANTIVLGPRGSGKTTLLKMLTLPALQNWRRRDRSKESARLSEELDYVAIYVPSDFTWYPDFRRAIKVEPQQETDDILSYALFRSHVLLAICDSMEHRAHPSLKDDPSLRRFAVERDDVKADQISKFLAKGWDLDPGIGGIYGLKRAVAQRIRQIQHLLTLTAIQATSAASLLERHQFLSAAFFDDLREFADTFDYVYGGKSRWAVCFDEVEIAPDPVKIPIWQSGRSFDPRYLIKLSASPYDADLAKLQSPRMPMPGHDFRQIDLSTESRHELFRFSQRMFTGICSEFAISPKRAEVILGTSFYDDTFDTETNEPWSASTTSLARSVGRSQLGRLAPEGFYNRKFQSLASKDQSFSNYLRDRDVNVETMSALPEFRKAALIRKILATVVIRDEFLFDRGQAAKRERRFRARKTVPAIYTGALSLFTICEGNPRWLIGLLRPLISEFAYAKDRLHIKNIERSQQAKRIERTITTLFTLLSTLRVGAANQNDLSIIELVERLGDFCFEQVLGERFNPEPILSFLIDDQISDPVYNAVGRAINQGALVLVPPSSASRDEIDVNATNPGQIRGRRIRLSFLLAPRYRLPLILGRSIDLSTVLDAPRHKRRGKVSVDQLILKDMFS